VTRKVVRISNGYGIYIIYIFTDLGILIYEVIISLREIKRLILSHSLYIAGLLILHSVIYDLFQMLCLEQLVTNWSSKTWVLYLFILLVRTADTSILDWFWSGSQDQASTRPKIGDVPVVKVPFEVTTEDEKFLQEAKKYTSLKVSDLDACQHHVSKLLWIR
jgi:hypothetical protein